MVVEFYIRPLSYELPYYNHGIERIEDLRYIDNIKTRDFHDGDYWEYRYRYDKENTYNGDYPNGVGIHARSHNDPTYDEYLYEISANRSYIKEE